MSFYKTLSHYYDVLFPVNGIQINFIQSFVQQQAKILDVAAGTGNQAIELAQLGYEVTATDLDEEMVDKIKQKLALKKVLMDVHALDMRNIDTFPSQSFEHILCIGNSLVHLNSIDEIKQTLSNMYNLLVDGGSVTLQVVNYDKVLQQQVTTLPIIDRPQEGITFIRTYEHEREKVRFNGKLVVKEQTGEEIYENSVELYPLTSSELLEALKQTGFRDIQLFGNFKKDNYHPESSPAIIAVAYKE